MLQSHRLVGMFLTSRKLKRRSPKLFFCSLRIPRRGRDRGHHWRGWEGRARRGTSSKQRAERSIPSQRWTCSRSKRSSFKRLSVGFMGRPAYDAYLYRKNKHHQQQFAKHNKHNAGRTIRHNTRRPRWPSGMCCQVGARRRFGNVYIQLGTRARDLQPTSVFDVRVELMQNNKKPKLFRPFF